LISEVSSPGVLRSTAKKCMPWRPLAGSVRASTAIVSQSPPSVMKDLMPSSTQSSPSRRAVVLRFWTSLPASGSVTASASRRSPAMFSRTIVWCSSWPCSARSEPATPWISATIARLGLALACSSIEIASSVTPRSAPPRDSGMCRPIRPAFAAAT